jgi:hypothetical protein
VIIMMVIVDGKWSLLLSSWACATTAKRGCPHDGGGGGGGLPLPCSCGHCCHCGRGHRGPFPPHRHCGGDDASRHCCCCKGGSKKGHPPLPSRERGKGGGDGEENDKEK